MTFTGEDDNLQVDDEEPQSRSVGANGMMMNGSGRDSKPSEIHK